MTINAKGQYVPDICETIRNIAPPPYRGDHQYRVTGWMKAFVEPPEEPCADPREEFARQLINEIRAEEAAEYAAKGITRFTLVTCPREEAEYVTGYGVCGIIWKIEDCVVTGTVNWSAEQVEQQRDRAARGVGRTLILNRQP